MLAALMAAGADLNALTESGRSCLTLAVRGGFFPTVVYLLKNTPALDVNHPGEVRAQVSHGGGSC